MVVNGDEFENIELRHVCEVNREGHIVSGGQTNRQPTPIPGSNDNQTPENLTTEVDTNDNSKTRDIIELSRELSKNLQNLALQGTQGTTSGEVPTTTVTTPPGMVPILPVAPELEKPRDLSSGYGSESGDMLRELVKNKELMKMGAPRKKELPRYSSIDSDVSEGSTLVSTSSDAGDGVGSERRMKARINHHSIRGTVSDTEVELHRGVSHLPVDDPSSP